MLVLVCVRACVRARVRVCVCASAGAGAGARLLRALSEVAGGGADAKGDTDGAALAASDVGFAANMQILRVLRVLRLIKLVRLVRASRVLQRWKSKVALSHGAQTLLSCLLVLVVASHWYACTLALMASLHADASHTWLGDYAFCTGEQREAVSRTSEDIAPSSSPRAKV